MNNSQTRRWLTSQRVAVLKGGWSKERPISLKTGAAVENAFRRLKIPFYSIDVRPNVVLKIKEKKITFCFNALHGPFGEDGQIQQQMDWMKIKYTGSGPTASALAMNKDLSKSIFRAAGLPVPWGFAIHKSDFQATPTGWLSQVASALKFGPLFIKPVDQGSAIGVARVTKPNQIQKALQACFKSSRAALVERLISGRELTVGILGQRPLPITEILPSHEFYDYHSKYAKGGSRHVTPAKLPVSVKNEIQSLGLKAFHSLGCRAVGRVDFIMQSPKRLFILEVNTIPGMTETSLLPEAAQKIGIGFDDLVLRIVALSL